MRNDNFTSRFILLSACLLWLCGCAKNPDAETQAAVHVEQGDQSFAGKDYDKAVQDYSAALKAKPEPRTYEKRARAYAAKGNHQAAIDDYYKVLDADQDAAAVWTELGISSTATAEFSVAESAFSKALRLDPNYADAYYYRALMYKAQGDTENVRADVKKFLAISHDTTLKAAAQTLLQELGAKGSQ
ncbi:MAG: tetratricopeptide repeat protein [Acidobacteria bacterium]|nr:tetratricopeptide repeat protein [Acidobacteriota bacterium]